MVQLFLDPKFILQLVFNALLYICWCFGFNLCLERKYPLGCTALLQAASFIPFSLLPQLFPYLSWMRLLACVLIPLLMLYLLYRNRFRVLLLMLLAVHAVGLISEVFLVLLFPYMAQPEAQPFPLVEFVFWLLSNMVLLSPLLIYGAHRKLTGGIRIHPATLLALSGAVFVQFFALCIITAAVLENYSVGRALQLLVFFLLLVLVDIILFLTWRIALQRSRISARSELLEKQLNFQLSHYAALNKQFENVRKMRHDIANHLYAARLLLAEKHVLAAEDYMNRLEAAFTQNIPPHYCEHPLIDAYLSHRCQELAKTGISVDAQLQLPAGLSIPNPDLICGFANLLDNAAEAVAAAEDKVIRLRAFLRQEYLVIETENAVPPQPYTRPRRIHTLERGLGFHILQDLANSHQGEFFPQIADGLFRAVLTLRAHVCVCVCGGGGRITRHANCCCV